jgi:16S rRNA pseudouridine516 synthase
VPVRAAAAEITAECALRLTLTEGKYHQVKRMLAAVGNRVDALHRSSFGALHIPPDVAAGEWCWADPAAISPPSGAGEAAPVDRSPGAGPSPTGTVDSSP